MKDEEENIEERIPHADAGNNNKVNITASEIFLLIRWLLKPAIFIQTGSLIFTLRQN